MEEEGVNGAREREGEGRKGEGDIFGETFCLIR